MRLRPAPLLLAALSVATLLMVGCSPGATKTEAPKGTQEQNGLAIGTVAPDFRMKNQDQETVALSDYKGAKNVVLVFYPADFTPV